MEMNQEERGIMKEELVRKTIKGDEEYYAQEDVIWRSIRGIGEIFRHLNNPNFKNIWTFSLAYLIAISFLLQGILFFSLSYPFFININSDTLFQIPIIIFILCEVIFIFVIGAKILLGLIRFLKTKKFYYIIAFVISLVAIMFLLFLVTGRLFQILQ